MGEHLSEHRWLGSWLSNGQWRGGCTCGERFSSSAYSGPYAAFQAHQAEVTPGVKRPAEVDQ